MLKRALVRGWYTTRRAFGNTQRAVYAVLFRALVLTGKVLRFLWFIVDRFTPRLLAVAALAYGLHVEGYTKTFLGVFFIGTCISVVAPWVAWWLIRYRKALHAGPNSVPYRGEDPTKG